MRAPPKGRVLGDFAPEQPHRPLMDRHNEGPVMDGGRTRLIGLELRVRTAYGAIEEVQMVPLDIELRGTANAACPLFFGPLTLHTSAGDVQIPFVPIPASAF